MVDGNFITVSVDLDRCGLVWHPEIGDEIIERAEPEKVSILVDPQGLSPGELRRSFIWLPTVEQLVEQFEARQAIIYHAGLGTTLSYELVVRTSQGVIESKGGSLRTAFGRALCELLNQSVSESIH